MPVITLLTLRLMFKVAICLKSSSVSWKSSLRKFSCNKSFLVAFGMTVMFRCVNHRSSTCAGAAANASASPNSLPIEQVHVLFPCACAIFWITGWSNKSPVFLSAPISLYPIGPNCE